MAMSAGPEEFSMTEYEAFQYLPPQAAIAPPDCSGKDSAWAQEMTRGQPEEDDEDDEDEFREEWSNDYFTKAYINNHQQQFRKIEEQEDLKEARLAEERERQRVVSGGPPRSAWMMAGSTASGPDTATAAPSTMATTSGQNRLRVPGLQEPFSADFQEQVSVDEFLQFRHDESPNGPSSMQPMLEPPHQQQLKPIKAEDRFLSLVSDLRLAEQIYYPGASSATLTDLEPTPFEQHSHVATVSSAGGGAWAEEFTQDHRYQQNQQQQQPQRHLGAEWNWEKLFGKDPRKTLQVATVASKAYAAMAGGPTSEMTEHERLKTVALARLQALFGHLSLTSPHEAPTRL
ncbi:hypothetical protein BGZ67_008706 [Mortierella alpina]|nr:hypothetical protein BGZ67_008706 [Mortierella alpina]